MSILNKNFQALKEIKRCKSLSLYIKKDFSIKGKTNIPNADVIRGIRELTPGALRMLLRMYQKTNGQKFLVADEAKFMNMSLKTATKAHRELQEKGFILLTHGTNEEYLYLGTKIIEDLLHNASKT